MSTPLVGEAGHNDITALGWATMTVPTNGDDVDAPVIISGVQRLLNNDADLADAIVLGISQVNEQLSTTGVRLLRNAITIANLKAISTTGLPDGAVCVVKDAVITGSVVSRVGLFVYDSSSTQAECAIPNIVDAYLVVTPNSGTGRWFNVAAGLGWNGTTGEFLPKPTPRIIPWQIAGDTQSQITVADGGGWTQLPPVVAPVLGSSDSFTFDFDFSVGAANADELFGFRVEVSYNGGSYTYVPGTHRQIGVHTDASIVPAYHSVHIGGTYQAVLGAGTYTFRVKFNPVGSSDCLFWQTWTARGVQYVAA